MWKQFRLMAPADAGGGAGAAGAGAAGAGGAGDSAGAAANAGAAQGAAANANGAAAGAATSALATGAAAGAAPTGLEFLAAKFHVKTADGKLDEAASLRKQAEGYAELEKVRPQGEAPPATAAEYKLTAPADVEPAAFEAWSKEPATIAALESMHKLGLNSKQVDAVMGMYLESAKQLAAGGPALTAEQTISELRKDWKTEADLTKGLGEARHAATVLGTRIGLDFAAIEASGLANHPMFIRMMSSLAPELGEDRAPSGAALPMSDLDSLVKSPAYMNPNDPNHAAVKAKVAQHFASQPGAANKPRGPVTISP